MAPVLKTGGPKGSGGSNPSSSSKEHKMKSSKKIIVETTDSRINREPRKGELNYELKKIITKHCKKKSFKDAIKSIQLSVARIARKYGVNEFECVYDRNTNTGHHKPWISESIEVRMYRKRPNGSISIYRSGATSYPHFFQGLDGRYANLSAPRDMSIFCTVDEQYAWEKFSSKKPRASLVAKWERARAKRNRSHS